MGWISRRLFNIQICTNLLEFRNGRNTRRKSFRWLYSWFTGKPLKIYPFPFFNIFYFFSFQVPVLWGALIECVATCMCRVASRALGDSGLRVAPIIDSFIATSLVVAGNTPPPLQHFHLQHTILFILFCFSF